MKEESRILTPIEIKSSSTFHESFSKNLQKIQSLDKSFNKGIIVYSGPKKIETDNYRLINFKNIS